jgi:hypothetical protein
MEERLYEACDPLGRSIVTSNGTKLIKNELEDKDEDASNTADNLKSPKSNLKKGGQSDLQDIGASKHGVMMVEAHILTQEEEKKWKSLMEDLKTGEIFAKEGKNPGRTMAAEHEIQFSPEGKIPSRMIFYRRSPRDRTLIDQWSQEMFDAGLIENSKAEYASQVVIVRREGRDPRFCIDYRAINAISRDDPYMLPRIEDILQSMEGMKYFSTIDLFSAYWQVPVKEDDKWKTAFITPKGKFQWRVMPFGLKNAPATFQRMMNKIFNDTAFAQCYLDDIVVYSKDFEEHLKHLEEVFTRLEENGLKCKQKKCHFFMKKVKLLGHIISEEGMKWTQTKSKP